MLRYKAAYSNFLIESSLTASDLPSPAKRREARKALAAEASAALLAYEASLPVATLAWCRMISQNHAIRTKSSRGRGTSITARASELGSPKASGTPGGADGDEDDIDETSELAKVDALDQLPKADERIEEAPDGYALGPTLRPTPPPVLRPRFSSYPWAGTSSAPSMSASSASRCSYSAPSRQLNAWHKGWAPSPLPTEGSSS